MAGKKITELPSETTLSDQHYIITQNYLATDTTKRTPLSLLKSFLNLVGKREASNSTAERFNHYNFSKSSFVAGDYAHSEGYGTQASGDYAHSEGLDTTASGSDAHSEGHNTTASGFAGHSEGDGSKSTGDYGHSEGYYTEAGFVSHAEGWYTKATNTSHAEGYYTEATGYKSHSEGDYTKAKGEASHAGGIQTIAAGTGQTAIGKYNIEDATSLFIIGCGTYNERKNALLVDENGNLIVFGSIRAEGGFERVITTTNVALTVDGWNGDIAPFTQSITVEGLTGTMLSTDIVISDDIATGIIEHNDWQKVTKKTMADGVITFSCYESKPTVTLNVKVISI